MTRPSAHQIIAVSSSEYALTLLKGAQPFIIFKSTAARVVAPLFDARFIGPKTRLNPALAPANPTSSQGSNP